MMHKPRGVVTTRSDERGRRTVYDLLPKSLPRVFPLGRLDKDSSGLLLFTNDTRFGERITNPLGMTPKCYSVELDRPLREKDRAAFARGLRLEDGTRCRPARVEHGGAPASYLITITEGKNRQVRRMCASLGYAVRVLERVGIGTVRLGSLPEGGVRSLTPGEVTSLVRAGTP
jgi:pseudouridine synthase